MLKRSWEESIQHWTLFDKPELESWNLKNQETWKPGVGIRNFRISGFQLQVSRLSGFQASRFPNLFSRRPNPIQHKSHPQKRKCSQQEIAIGAKPRRERMFHVDVAKRF